METPVENSTVIPNAPKTKKKGTWGETIRFFIIALAIVIPLRMFVAEPFIVSGHSMDPTLQDGEYMIIDQLSYRIGEPKRGEVVVFKYPKNPSVYYIKRIIGLPGETVTISDNTVTVTNAAGTSHVLDEGYIVNKNTYPVSLKTTLGPEEYFVLGDNRPVSSDSRVWGPLDKKFIVGTPLVSLFPVSRIGLRTGDHLFDF